MDQRGTYSFDIQPNGNLANNPNNLERMRKLFRDATIIKGKWGPGRQGDFDNGSWHILCHLTGGSGVYDWNGHRLWVGIAHKPSKNEYEATISYRNDEEMKSAPLESSESQRMIGEATLLGFIEGSSCGHILARQANDPPSAFNGWPRQEFDQDIRSKKSGGTVWEHWCTTRDLRESNPAGNTLLRGYLALVASLGGKFVAAVARGRRSHEHPLQLCAMVKAGALTDSEATWKTTPFPIWKEIQDLLYEARPSDYVAAAETLAWSQGEMPTYFMFNRCIRSWSSSEKVKRDLSAFSS